MMGLASGPALTGMLPWVYSIAPFAPYRCLELLRNYACLPKLPLRIARTGAASTPGNSDSTPHAPRVLHCRHCRLHV